MKETLLEAVKIGEFLKIGAVLEKSEKGQEIGLFLASADVSCSCAFLPEEWEKFVDKVNRIDRRLKEKLNK